MLKLPDVTLVLVDTCHHKAAALAVETCQKHIRFGRVALFSNKVLDVFNGTHIIHQLDSVQAWEKFIWYRMPGYITTSHALIVQYDSWVLNPDLWDDEFLKYDYIGAPWGWHGDGLNTGNGGFSLRSKKLMCHLLDNPVTYPCLSPEDDKLCRKYRPVLESKGFVWAPDELAMKFAFERVRPAKDSRHFGFHGVFNWPFVLSEDDLKERLDIVLESGYSDGLNMAGVIAMAARSNFPWMLPSAVHNWGRFNRSY